MSHCTESGISVLPCIYPRVMCECMCIGGVLGIDLTEVSTMLSQGEDFTRYNTSELRNMVSIHMHHNHNMTSATVIILQITISSKEHLHNRIKTPDSPFSDAEDPTG